MNRNTTIVLVAIFGALLLYVLLVQLPRDRAEAEATPTAGAAVTYLWTLTADQITGVRVVDEANDRSVAFSKDASGAWVVTEPASEPADQTAASSAATRFVNLGVSSAITTTTDLAPFGVLDPAYTLHVSLADGSQLEAAVGDKTPLGTGYYVLRSGESNVVVVNAVALEGITQLVEMPPLVPTATPEATATGAVAEDGTPTGEPEPAGATATAAP